MSVVFNVILHLLLVGSMALFFYAVVNDSIKEPDPAERILRIAALGAGAMVALGAQVSGMSYAIFTVDALSGARSASAAAAFAAAVIPALAGVGIGFYLVRTFRQGSAKGARVFGFVAMLAVTAFAAVYAQATKTQGVFLGVAALPNISFSAGVILTIVFTYDSKSEKKQTDGLGDLARGMLSRNRTPATSAGAVRVPGAHAGWDSPTGPMDPFAAPSRRTDRTDGPR